MRHTTLRLAPLGLVLLSALPACQSPDAAPSPEAAPEVAAMPDIAEPPIPDGMHSPPYTAAQIAASHPAGTFTSYRLSGGPSSMLQRTEWTASSPEGCEMRMTASDPSGAPMGPERTASAVWWELRNHAVSPLDVTTVSDDSIEIEAGAFDCWLYTLATDGGQVRMWFDKRSAGSPVLMVETKDGVEASRMELVETNRLPLQAH